MNINPESLYRATQSSSTPQPAATGRRQGPRTPEASAPAGDALSFSARAETFLSARARLEALPQPSREERVAKLARLVASGAYAVDGQAVADAMLADEPTAGMFGLGTAR
jgi:flagellar biosynthesis anti-sigma factor FlgM